jgi:hypothetical protein
MIPGWWRLRSEQLANTFAVVQKLGLVSTIARESELVDMNKIWDSLQDVELHQNNQDYEEGVPNHCGSIPDRRPTNAYGFMRPFWSTVMELQIIRFTKEPKHCMLMPAVANHPKNRRKARPHALANKHGEPERAKV